MTQESLLSADPSLTDALTGLGVPAKVALAVVVLLALPKIFDVLKMIGRLVAFPFRRLYPLFYGREKREARAARRRLAQILLQNLDITESAASWSSSNFSEFSGTVESVDQSPRIRPFLGLRRSSSVRRTKSLTRTLVADRSQIINLQGRPGSGKTIALRQVARVSLEQLRSGRGRTGNLALLVDLRDFDAPADTVDVSALIEYMRRKLNPRNGVELNEYFSNSLQTDLATGGVLVLFDSFDEIPAVVDSPRVDSAVAPFVETIASLMGAGKSRCIVASRPYKGPKVGGWTRVELAPLSYDEQIKLLKAAGVRNIQMPDVEPLLREASRGFAADLRKPLELSLLAEYLRVGSAPLSSPSQLFESRVESALEESAETEEQLRCALGSVQRIAIKMLDDGSGLIVTRSELHAIVTAEAARDLPADESPDLEFVGEVVQVITDSRLMVAATLKRAREVSYSFVHRRVLEYLATKAVMAGLSPISGADLALRRQWRETAVSMLQLGQGDRFSELNSAIEDVLAAELIRIRAAGKSDHLTEVSADAVHILEMLSAAFGANPERASGNIRTTVGDLAGAVWTRLPISEKRLMLDCIALAEPSTRLDFINRAFSGRSAWLRLTALRRCSDLTPLPDKVAEAIRRLLITLLAGGAIRRERAILDSDLRRIYGGAGYVWIRRIVTAIPIVVILLCLARVSYAAWLTNDYSPSAIQNSIIYALLFPLLLFWVYQSSPPMSYDLVLRGNRFVDRFSRWLLSDQMDQETSAIWSLAWIIVSTAFLVFLGIGAFYLAMGWESWSTAGLSAINYLIIYFSLLWGICALHVIRYQPEITGIHRLLIVLIGPIYYLPVGLRGLIRHGSGFLGYLGRTTLFVGVIIAIGYGLDFLGEHAGAVGRGVRTSIIVIFFLPYPITIVVLLGLEIAAITKVRMALRDLDGLSERRMLETMLNLGADVNCADYVRRLTLFHEGSLRAIGLDFLNRLMRAIEGAPTRSIQVSDGSYVMLPAGTLRRWSGSTLDELGRLFDQIRER